MNTSTSVRGNWELVMAGEVIESVNNCNIVFTDAGSLLYFSSIEVAALLKGLASPVPNRDIVTISFK